MAYNTARQNAATQQAWDKLNNYFARGREEGLKLFDQISKMVIVDYMLYTQDMRFAPAEAKGLSPIYSCKVGHSTSQLGTVKTFKLHPHALRQMASQVSIPVNFVRTLTDGEDWERRELSDLLTERFNKLDFKQRGSGKDRFMNRVVDGEVRGFVSRMYSRHISSGPILEAFVRSSNRFGAMPASAIATDLSFTLRCFLPHVFEPVDGEFVGIGCSCSNSDFGAGTLRIGLSVIRVNNGSVSYVKDTHTERHLSRADNSADTSVELSQDTIKKQILAKQGEVEDIVAATLHPDKVNEFLDMVAKAIETKISWYQLERFLQGKLGKEEMLELEQLLAAGDPSGELPPVTHDPNIGNDVATLWWASSAVSRIADRQTSSERKAELQDVAGAILVR